MAPHGYAIIWLSIHQLTDVWVVFNFWQINLQFLTNKTVPDICVIQIYFNLFIYFNWRLITLQYCGGFCHILTWISHGCTYVPHPKPLSHLPPHLIPLGCPSAPASALNALFHALNLDWSSILHTNLYMVIHFHFSRINTYEWKGWVLY